MIEIERVLNDEIKRGNGDKLFHYMGEQVLNPTVRLNESNSRIIVEGTLKNGETVRMSFHLNFLWRD
jgi:hypothetical protein